jgi:fructose-1,6-bisphosphatase/inositol monophosphatase family enzyme
MFKSISEFFKNVFFPKVKAFLKKVFTSAVQIAIGEIQDLVRTVVADLASEDLTNAEKRAEAYRRIVAELKASGKSVKESIIRATIELAVLELKQDSGATDEQSQA